MTSKPATFDLSKHGITVSEVHHNLSPSKLYEHAIRHEKDATIAENGALVAYSGVKTGRSQGQARRQARGLRGRSLVGPGEHPARPALLRHQPRARPRLPQHARAAVLFR